MNKVIIKVRNVWTEYKAKNFLASYAIIIFKNNFASFALVVHATHEVCFLPTHNFKQPGEASP